MYVTVTMYGTPNESESMRCVCYQSCVDINASTIISFKQLVMEMMGPLLKQLGEAQLQMLETYMPMPKVELKI